MSPAERELYDKLIKELKATATKEHKDTRDFQRQMAAKLRQFTMRALTGEILSGHDNLERTRDSLRRGEGATDDEVNSPYQSMESYLLDQGPDKAEATDLSLAVLADALGLNIVLCNPDLTNGGVQSQALNLGSYDPQKPTICVTGGYGHWDAFVDCEFDERGKVISGHIARAAGDGNCGYNAVALALAAYAKTINAPKVSPEMSSVQRWTPRMEQSNARNAVKAVSEAIKEIKGTPEATDSYSTSLVSKILETQTKRWNSSSKHESPEVHEERTISAEEKEQIKQDEALAWKIAAKDVLDDEESENDSLNRGPR